MVSKPQWHTTIDIYLAHGRLGFSRTGLGLARLSGARPCLRPSCSPADLWQPQQGECGWLTAAAVPVMLFGHFPWQLPKVTPATLWAPPVLEPIHSRWVGPSFYASLERGREEGVKDTDAALQEKGGRYINLKQGPWSCQHMVEVKVQMPC